MKKIICVLAALVLLMNTCALAEESALTIAPAQECSAEEIAAAGAAAENLQLTDRVTEASGCHTALITWQKGGNAYEACIGGLDQALTEEQARTIIGCYTLGIPCSLTADGLIDAEKASNKLPTMLGTPVLPQDDVRKDYSWGDSSQCWAGSLADMLTITGWGQKAVNPDTGAAFADEDELFSYFTRNFSNSGSYQSDGAVWFFNGFYERDTNSAELREEGTGALLKEYDVPVTKYSAADTPDNYYENCCGMLLSLRDGGCLGIDLEMWQNSYPLKSDENETALYDNDRHAYLWSELFFVDDKETLTDQTFILADGTGAVVLVTDNGDGTYSDSEGSSYPEARVLTGKFAEHEGGLYPASCEPNNDEYTYNVDHLLTEDDLNMDAPEDTAIGMHALTAIGYIRCTEGDTGFKALMIIDSDNDAHCFSPVTDAVLKQDRPNTYTMYFTQDSDKDDVKVLALTDYIGRLGKIAGLTLMTAAE